MQPFLSVLGVSVLAHIFISIDSLICPEIADSLNATQQQRSLIDVSIRMVVAKNPIIEHPFLDPIGGKLFICISGKLGSERITDEQIRFLKHVKFDNVLVIPKGKSMVMVFPFVKKPKKCPRSKYLTLIVNCMQEGYSNYKITPYSNDECNFWFMCYQHAVCKNTLVDKTKVVRFFYHDAVREDIKKSVLWLIFLAGVIACIILCIVIVIFC